VHILIYSCITHLFFWSYSTTMNLSCALMSYLFDFLVLVEFGAYSRFVSPLLVLIVWIIFKFFHFIQLLFTFRCVVINHQKRGDYAHLGPQGMFR
jgi:hypothetical protein